MEVIFPNLLQTPNVFRHGKREKHQIHRAKIRAEKRSRVYSCQSCDFSTPSTFNLVRHIQRLHINVKRSLCKHCDKSFKDNDTLETHIKFCHLRERKFPCPECQKSFVSSSDLNRHKKMVHINLRQFECSECGKTFHTSSNAKRHLEEVCNKRKIVSTSNVSPL